MNGSILPILKMVRGIYETDYAMSYFKLNEGLIKSYPAKSLVRHLMDFFMFRPFDSKNELTPEQYKDIGRTCNGYVCLQKGQNNTETIEIAIHTDITKFKTKRSNATTLNFVLYPYGWFLASIQLSSEYNDIQYLVYEKKYSSDTPVDFYDIKYLYHICEKTVCDKILRIGLIPKTSQDMRFMHPDRIYCSTGIPSEIEFEVRAGEFKRYKYKHMHNREVTFCLLRIDMSKICNDFFYDPRYYGAVYTLEPIPPAAIAKIDEITV